VTSEGVTEGIIATLTARLERCHLIFFLTAYGLFAARNSDTLAARKIHEPVAGRLAGRNRAAQQQQQYQPPQA